MMVDVGAQPMRVRHAIVRARGDEQPFVLKPSRGVVGRGTRVMAIEGEAALETATDIGISVQPPAVRGEVIAVCQAVAPRESFQREIRKGSRRFADRKSRMAPSLEKKNIVSEARENSRRERTGRTRYRRRRSRGARSSEVTFRAVDSRFVPTRHVHPSQSLDARCSAG